LATGQLPDRLSSIVSPIQLAAGAGIERRAPVLTPIERARAPRPGFYQRRGKRTLDLALGAMLFVVLLPLIAAIACAVLVISGRPVLYASERAGRDGRRFRMWKFRTMDADADAQYEQWKQTHPHLASELSTNWKLQRDPRVTALGRFLRKSSLDELPQFWNVLRGEMSLVGPRPYLPREVIEASLAQAIAAVQPGLTGPFQVRGRKSLSPLSRMEIEATYSRDVGLLRDLGYGLRTLKPLITLDGQ
jgi:lipopolysaccharide/colanic/teichoic acid biosynthesis glycosyltransferase